MELDNTKICVGIDLGTTNSSGSYSWLDIDDVVHVEDLNIKQKDNGIFKPDVLVPSILFVKENGEEVIGNEAKELKENSFKSSGDEVRYLENVKRYIGTKKKFIINNKEYSPIDVASLILSYIKNNSQIKKNIKGDYYTVITVPANFNNDQRNDTLEAAKRAGFENVQLYDEPRAAILSFLHEESLKLNNKLLDLSTSKRILVIDIGGGTCDISVEDVRQEDRSYIFSHKAIGRENLGGVDFDKRIGDELSKNFLSNIILTPNEIASLRNMGQKIKEMISGDIDYYIDENLDGDDSVLYKNPNWIDLLSDEISDCSPSRFISGKNVQFNMSLREFVSCINTLVYSCSDISAKNKDEREATKSMEQLINETLDSYSISLDSIDMIFLTGGMAKCFPLKAALFDIFNKPIICPTFPFLAVSRGASLINKYKNKDETIKDLMPNAIMLEMSDGRLKNLVNIGETIPVTKEVPEIFKTTSRNGIVIKLFEGKNEFDCDLRKINNIYKIQFDTPKPLGREFKIQYTVDETRRIEFTIKFLDNNETYKIGGQIREGK